MQMLPGAITQPDLWKACLRGYTAGAVTLLAAPTPIGTIIVNGIAINDAFSLSLYTDLTKGAVAGSTTIRVQKSLGLPDVYFFVNYTSFRRQIYQQANEVTYLCATMWGRFFTSPGQITLALDGWSAGSNSVISADSFQYQLNLYRAPLVP